MSTVLTLLMYRICKTGHNKIIKKKVRIMDKSNIIITHNCQTYIWLNHYNEYGDILWKEFQTMH